MKSHLSAYLVLLIGLALFTIHCGKSPSGDTPAASGEVLFEKMEHTATGIDFVNKIIEDFDHNIMINTNMYNGGGVAVLDVNNDGLSDVYFVSSQEKNKLFLNEGNWTFKEITDQAGVAGEGGFKTGVTVVDINADGYQDIYVCRAGPKPGDHRRNLLFVNNGNGTFTEKAKEYGLDDASASNHALFVDYDLDGDLDAYVLNYPVDFGMASKIEAQQENGIWRRARTSKVEWNLDRLYENQGNGKFVDVTEKAGVANQAFGLSVSMSYFNSDLYPDLYIGNDFIDPDVLWINNGDGTFSDQTFSYFDHTSLHTMGVNIEDFNNDGLSDLIANDMIAEDNRRQKLLINAMKNTRVKQILTHGYGKQVQRNVLQLNNGNQSFSEIGCLSGIFNTDWSWAPLMQDFDNDGWKDLFISNGYKRDVSELDFVNFTYDSIRARGGITKTNFAKIEDFLNLVPSEKLPNYAFRNKRDLTFEHVGKAWGLDHSSFSGGAAFADFDNDGDLDLMVNNIDDQAFVYKNKSSESSTQNWLQFKFKGSGQNPFGIGARVKITAGPTVQYQELSPNKGFFSAVELLIHFGLGTSTSVDKVEIIWPDGQMQTLTAVRANQRIVAEYVHATEKYAPANEASLPVEPMFTALSGQHGLSYRHIENEYDDFDHDGLLPRRFSNLGPALATGDVNGDGLTDFYIGGAFASTGRLFLQTKSGEFTPHSEPAFAEDGPVEDIGAAFFDADGDKDLDLYVVSGGNEASFGSSRYWDRLYINDGKGNFAKKTDLLPFEFESGSVVSPHDYDGDGDLDLFVGGRVAPQHYPYTSKSLVFKNDGGKFTDVSEQVAPDFIPVGLVTGIEWGDIDGDGKAEMVLSGEWMPITIFKYDGNKFNKVVTPNGLEQTDGWWNCLKLSDMDKDGDLDIVAGNWGLNTRFKPTAEFPLTIYAKDFDKNGKMDPIIAYWNNGKCHPVAQKDILIQQIPSLKKKFLHYATYANATIHDIYPKEELESEVVKYAKILGSCWLENDGKGNFKTHLFPNEAQVSPVKDLCLEDFNGDGNLDILLAGNDQGADPETGWCDAGRGLLLLNNGKGQFKPALSRETGFWAPNDTRNMRIIDLANGKKMVLIANNNGPLQAFQFESKRIVQ